MPRCGAAADAGAVSGTRMESAMDKKQPREIPAEELARQRDFCGRIRERNEQETARTGREKRALIETYGCQQNLADSERMMGILEECGYRRAEGRQDADLILFNTCAVREHAELKVFGNLGALKALKAERPSLVIGVCGCMMQQQKRVDEVMKKYKHVDMVFGTHTFYRLPEILAGVLFSGERTVAVEQSETAIAEGLPVVRESGKQAWVTIMYGCNNFCTYCIVPYLRGRERSRAKEKVLEEVRGLVERGYAEITLLGQNVNSYGKDLYEDYGFAELLEEIDRIDGDFIVRFMTSHPKDASRRLIDVIADSRHMARQLHLPVQAGSNRILERMNRRYTRESYIELVEYAKARIRGLALTSDMIVAFPGETEEDFAETLDLVERVQFDSLFTFIYSPRSGTPAAEMEGQIPHAVGADRLERLIAAQAEVSRRKNEALVGTVVPVLAECVSKTDDSMITGRTEGGKLLHFPGGPELVGRRLKVRVTSAGAYAMLGELVSDPGEDLP